MLLTTISVIDAPIGRKDMVIDMNIYDLRDHIMQASRDDIDALYAMINGRLKVLDGTAMQKFNLGDNVSFDAGRRGTIHGKITGFSRSRVKVLSDHGNPWTVSASLLTVVSR
jgi:hypothetical protein